MHISYTTTLLSAKTDAVLLPVPCYGLLDDTATLQVLLSHPLLLAYYRKSRAILTLGMPEKLAYKPAFDSKLAYVIFLPVQETILEDLNPAIILSALRNLDAKLTNDWTDITSVSTPESYLIDFSEALYVPSNRF